MLEEKGIGRPSTYAKIIETLNKREYVYNEEKKFVPTDLGINVVDYLEENFHDIMNYNFTADLEKELDLVAEGKLDWVTGIDQFYKKLALDLEKVKDGKKVELLTGEKCPDCGGDLVKKYSLQTRGWFVGLLQLSGMHLYRAGDAEQRKDRQGRDPGKAVPQVRQAAGQAVFAAKRGSISSAAPAFPPASISRTAHEELGACPQCGKPLTKRFSRKTRRYFVGCSGYPECKFIQKR